MSGGSHAQTSCALCCRRLLSGQAGMNAVMTNGRVILSQPETSQGSSAIIAADFLLLDHYAASSQLASHVRHQQDHPVLCPGLIMIVTRIPHCGTVNQLEAGRVKGGIKTARRTSLPGCGVSFMSEIAADKHWAGRCIAGRESVSVGGPGQLRKCWGYWLIWGHDKWRRIRCSSCGLFSVDILPLSGTLQGTALPPTPPAYHDPWGGSTLC